MSARTMQTSLALIGVAAAAALMLPSLALAQDTIPAPNAGPIDGPVVTGEEAEALEQELEMREEMAEADDERAERDDSAEEASWLEQFIEYELDRIIALDLYGITSQLPAGWLKIGWDWGMIDAGSRYNGDGELGPVFDPIRFEQNGDLILSADLGLSGTGSGHTLQISYGITDPLDWYVEMNWFRQSVSINPTLEPIDPNCDPAVTACARIDPGFGGIIGVEDPTAYDAEQFLYETFPLLGRPAPDSVYEGRRVFGDLNTGFSWNFFRSNRMSAALTPRIFLPTGHVPDANSSIFYATGPALETSTGGWATSVTQGYDFRLLQLGQLFGIVASTDVTLGYAFKQNRDYPTNFTVPDPLASQLDPLAFPDLSHLEGTFEYTPGFSFSWTNQVGIQVGPLGIALGYGVQHSTAPRLGGDEAFIGMVNSLELVGDQTQYLAQIGGSLSLLPLSIPMNIGFSYRRAVAGENAIVFDNYFTISAEIFVPMYVLWNRRPWEDEE